MEFWNPIFLRHGLLCHFLQLIEIRNRLYFAKTSHHDFISLPFFSICTCLTILVGCCSSKIKVEYKLLHML